MKKSDELKFAEKVAAEYGVPGSNFNNEYSLAGAQLAALVSIARSLESMDVNGVETMSRND